MITILKLCAFLLATGTLLIRAAIRFDLCACKKDFILQKTAFVNVEVASQFCKK